MSRIHFGVTPWQSAPDAGTGERVLEQAETAERLGFDSFWLPESHFVADAVFPAPLLVLAAVAARTTRLHLGTTSYLLPMRHPLLVAEEVSVLDRLSGGRLILGVGRGFRPALFEAFDVPAHEKRDRFESALAAMQAAWRGEPVARLHSEGGSRAPIRLTPRPQQQPHPPIWVAAFGPKALAQAGRLNLPYLASPLESLSRLAENHELHRAARPEDLREQPLAVPVIRTVFVTRDAACARRVRAGLASQARALAKGAARGLPSPAATAPEEWALVGDPDAVARELERYRDRIGLTHLIARIQAPGATSREANESVRMLAELAAEHSREP